MFHSEEPSVYQWRSKYVALSDGEDEDEELDDAEPPDFLTQGMQNSTSTVSSPQTVPTTRVSNDMESIRLNDTLGPEVLEPPPDLMGTQTTQQDMGIEPYQPTGDPQIQNGSNSTPPQTLYNPNMPRFDTIWANVYIGLLAMQMATSLMIYLSTWEPQKVPLGDSMYTTLKAAWGTFAWDICIALVVSCGWLYILRSWAQPVISVSLVAAPVSLTALAIYSLVMSYRSPYGGNAIQDKVMRWGAWGILVGLVAWVYIIYRGKEVLTKSIGLIRLASQILADNSPLLLVSAGTIVGFVAVTTIFISLFTRVFLRGHVIREGGKLLWSLNGSSWMFGAAYIFMYLWTWGVVSGIQRTTVSATVSQWYFYRHEFPQPSPRQVVYNGFVYSISSQFGSICLSALIGLLARLPFYILPGRVLRFVQLIVYNLASASVVSLTNPLALTYATINAQGLVPSASGLANLQTSRRGDMTSVAVPILGLTPYRLAKVLLMTGRAITALFLGFLAWIHAADAANGSLYGYMIGLFSSFIGWFTLGATEGTLSMIVDSTYISYCLEGEGGQHCTDATRLFSD